MSIKERRDAENFVIFGMLRVCSIQNISRKPKYDDFEIFTFLGIGIGIGTKWRLCSEASHCLEFPLWFFVKMEFLSEGLGRIGSLLGSPM